MCDSPATPQVEECSITFNAKISSVTQTQTFSNATASVSGSASGTFAGIHASLSASYSNQETQQHSNSEQREFSMAIYVHAQQAALPPGTAKLLSILEEAVITSILESTGQIA